MPKSTLLLVDDSPNILKALARVFRPEGYNLLLADSAKEAMEILARDDVDLVITDEHMPGLSGTDLLRVVRERYPAVMRFMVTGSDDIEVAKNAINNGEVYRCFTKPWDDFELLVCVKQALSHRTVLIENEKLRKVITDRKAQLKELEHQFPGISAAGLNGEFVTCSSAGNPGKKWPFQFIMKAPHKENTVPGLFPLDASQP